MSALWTVFGGWVWRAVSLVFVLGRAVDPQPRAPSPTAEGEGEIAEGVVDGRWRPGLASGHLEERGVWGGAAPRGGWRWDARIGPDPFRVVE